MTGAKIFQFPRPPISEKTAPRIISGGAAGFPITRCEGLVHTFEHVPGRCQCGEELWTEVEEAPRDART